MDPKSFNDLDESLMKALEKEREKSVPGEILRDFDSAVQRKIKNLPGKPLMGMGVVLPLFAFVLMALMVWWFLMAPKPTGQPEVLKAPAPVTSRQEPQAPSGTQ